MYKNNTFESNVLPIRVKHIYKLNKHKVIHSICEQHISKDLKKKFSFRRYSHLIKSSFFLFYWFVAAGAGPSLKGEKAWLRGKIENAKELWID